MQTARAHQSAMNASQTGEEPTVRQGKRERAQVKRVAGTAATLGKVALQDDGEPSLARPLQRSAQAGQTQPARELAQKLEQRQVRPRRRLRPLRRRVGDSHRSPRHRRAQHRLKLAEGGLLARPVDPFEAKVDGGGGDAISVPLKPKAYINGVITWRRCYRDGFR